MDLMSVEQWGRGEVSLKDVERQVADGEWWVVRGAAGLKDGPQQLVDPAAIVIADDRPGPSALVDETRDRLALSQRARELASTEDQWPLHVASTLMSGFVIGGATSGRP
jgi:hypothetical protein